ncbi:YegS/Rv2252/BmrU family lipid kinase [Segetibacter sp. 3557_3]|uniref:diacylglycerol/lipid kinase family protein n=1 Tax=Segetibacter sp. 3557_3 TaxID=2547429 RepID=UPI0010585B7F|nr:YegS/Rv2252/BmrU family lipid kinase [Segetibacter sp. 3557_3]TDH20044.1 YegS/Rv2252/BmrU family lipid kinase [Segetibacter sp. 3557_3]
MDQPEKLNLLFVINPISGGKKKTDFEIAIKEHCESLPHDLNIVFLTGKNDEELVQKEIKRLNPQRVVGVGGDGTITMVAKQLLGTGIPLGILPAGSANGMARELDIPENITAALDIVLKGQVKCCDVIKINKEICLHLSDIGLNAQLVKYFEESNMRGKLGYARMVFKVLLKRRVMRVVVETANEQLKRNAVMLVLANASKYGTGAVINPEGDLYDGLFEVIIVRKLAFSELVKMWFRPQPFNPKKIEVLHATAVTIETSHKVHFQVDGEYLGKVQKVTAAIQPRQLNIMLPWKEDEKETTAADKVHFLNA